MLNNGAEPVLRCGDSNTDLMVLQKTFGTTIFVYTIICMDYEFDTAKDESNLDKHGLSLADTEGFEWETAVVREDTRKQYAEQRFEATGLIGDRLHVMVYCLRGDVVRVISLRKTNPREVKCYVAEN
jgi:uncharacterized DUF497 family protein